MTLEELRSMKTKVDTIGDIVLAKEHLACLGEQSGITLHSQIHSEMPIQLDERTMAKIRSVARKSLEERLAAKTKVLMSIRPTVLPIDRATEIIRRELESGDAPAADVVAKAQEEGISRRTVYRAANEIGVIRLPPRTAENRTLYVRWRLRDYSP